MLRCAKTGRGLVLGRLPDTTPAGPQMRGSRPAPQLFLSSNEDMAISGQAAERPRNRPWMVVLFQYLNTFPQC